MITPAEAQAIDALKDGGPAFPVTDFIHPNGQVEHGFIGMSLRDWFAGMVISGMAGWRSFKDIESIETAVQQAYSVADAMLKERAEQ